MPHHESMNTHLQRLGALLAGFLAFVSIDARAAETAQPPAKYTFVLVHGATAGACERPQPARREGG